MSLQFLKAEQQPTQYYFQVWIDNTKTLADGKTPDPSYIYEYIWALTPPQGQTASQYLTDIKTEINLLVQEELKAVSAPITLTGF